MATNRDHDELERQFYEEIRRYIWPNITKKELMIVNKYVVNISCLQLSTFFEQAIIIVNGKIKSKSTIGQDFCDRSDAKLSTVRLHNSGQSYGAPITKVHTKRGLLRVMVYERILNKFYYFVIPYSAYKNMTRRTQNIEIPFHLNGTPRRIPSRPIKVNWWEYEVGSFETMARASRVRKRKII